MRNVDLQLSDNRPQEKAVAHECGKSVSSVIGRASMSALRATTGLPLPMVATTPVLAAGNLKHQSSHIIDCSR